MLETLPEELILAILDRLPTSERARLALVCTVLRSSSQTDLKQFHVGQHTKASYKWLKSAIMRNAAISSSLQSLQLYLTDATPHTRGESCTSVQLQTTLCANHDCTTSTIQGEWASSDASTWSDCCLASQITNNARIKMLDKSDLRWFLAEWHNDFAFITTHFTLLAISNQI